jgi:hypothetical protein
MINRTIDITVTSVHQTTAGKMIFGRYDERAEQQARQPAVPILEANGPRSETRTNDSSRRNHEASRESSDEPASRAAYPDPDRT